MQRKVLHNKKLVHRQSISLALSLVNQEPINSYGSLKKITQFQLNKRKSNVKGVYNNFMEQKKQQTLDHVRQRDSNQTQLTEQEYSRPKTKGVRFRDRVSIEKANLQQIKQKNVLKDTTNNQKIETFYNLLKNKHVSLPMTSRRRVPQNIRIVSDLINCPVQSKSSHIHQLKCFMCHYPDHNSQLFSKRLMASTKQRVKQLTKLQNQTNQVLFRYDAFGAFLKTITSITDINNAYDSHQTLKAFEVFLNKYHYPIMIRLMLYYMGSYLYQINCMYDKAQEVLKKLLNELLKYKLYEYVGIYLVLMVKIKANLLEWENCIKYLTKLLAYAWLHKLENLQIWVYFQLSRSYFFLNKIEESEYFQLRSQKSLCQPSSNLYRQLVAKQFKAQMQQMRMEHKYFTFHSIISVCQLMKLPQYSSHTIKSKQTFKIQSQIKRINQHCKIKYVKNLINRMNTQQPSTTKRLSSKQNFSIFNDFSNKCLAGNPLLRTHQSGLKNLNVYFRNHNRGKSIVSKSKQSKLYTFQQSNKNILVLKQMCRNILLEMKWYIPINVQDN